MALLSFEGVSFTFPGGARALRGIDLEIQAGEYLLLAGPNGAGKSALLRCANGLSRPQEGRVLLRGRDIFADLRDTRRAVALMMQSAEQHFVAATVAEDLAFGPENYGLSAAETSRRVNDVLSQMNIQSLRDTDPLLLSGGEKRRAAIAGLLALEPDILLLDEPFASLDYAGVRSVLAAMRSLHARGITVVAVTHAVEKLAAEATRMVLMEAGRIVADGPPGEVVFQGAKHGLAPVTGPLERLTWLG